MKRFNIYLITLMLIFGLTVSAQATVIGSSGDMTWLATPPASVVFGDLTSNDNMFGFTERQTYVLVSDLYVNGIGPGLHQNTGAAPQVIAAGTTIDSYFFQVDPTLYQNTILSYLATVNFDTDIRGVIFTETELSASNILIGYAGTTYPQAGLSGGFEAGICGTNVTDCVTISPDLRSVTIDLRTTNHFDQLRIITEATTNPVPEPSSLILLGSSLAILGLAHCFSKLAKVKVLGC